MATFNPNDEKSALNQYWYSPTSIEALVREITHNATTCAFLSTPSLFFALPADSALRKASKVFEFDTQWNTDPGFVFYDFNKPEHIPVQLLEAFDYVVVDPPFITREVWSQYMKSVKALLAPGGKVLFTSVLENHGMLESLLDGCLFVPRFRPSIPNLTYQYHCFLNYEPTQLQFDNAELPPEDPKIRAALRMANDLRESEKAFTAQMQNRDREGEQPLPALLRRQQQQQKTDDKEELDLGVVQYGTRVMQWTHIPEGLTMYANGATTLEESEANAAAPVSYGPDYESAEKWRGQLDIYKKGIDQSQKFLDQLLRLVAKKKTAEDPEYEAVNAQRLALLDQMDAITEAFVAARPQEAPLVRVMQQCTAEYRAAVIEKMALQELAADATRKFKSPVFNRQKELLADMKVYKAKATAAASAAPVDEAAPAA